MTEKHMMPGGRMMAGSVHPEEDEMDLDSLYAESEQETPEPASIQVDAQLLPEAEVGSRFTFEVSENSEGKVGLRLVPEPDIEEEV